MNTGFHFLSHSNHADEPFCSWLLTELKNRHEGWNFWSSLRDLTESTEPWEQLEIALQRCSSFIHILSDITDSNDDFSVDLWKRAISYNKPITVIQTKHDQVCPLSLSTRKLIDFSIDQEQALILLIARLNRLPTPEGQLETLREQLAGTRKASNYAKSANKERFNNEIKALEQQIAALEAPSEQKVTSQERLQNNLELQRRPNLVQPKEEFRVQLRFVNAPPIIVPRYFENRYIETGLIGDFLRDPGSCILTVHGRGGVGKTALTCRVLRELEKDMLPDNGGALKVSAVIYLNATRANVNLFPEFLSGLFITLNIQAQQDLLPLIENSSATVATKLRSILPHLAPEPTIVLLDNFEDVLSTEDARIKDPEISELLQFLADFPQHSLKIIITSRVIPEEVLAFSPARHIKISLTEGLTSPHAEHVLRKLDFDGSAGLKKATDLALSEVVDVTRGYPRALEAFYSIIAADPTKEMEDVITDLRRRALPAEKLTRVIVGEAFSRLLPIEQKVIQSLAIYARPVSLVAIEYLLTNSASYVEIAPLLKRLVAIHFIRCEGKKYYLHPIDREYALSFLTPDELKILRRLAGDYFQETQKPRSDWKSLDDIEPHLEQFRLRLEGDDTELAASILDELWDFLDSHGGFEQKYSLAMMLNQSTNDDDVKSIALKNLANAQWRMGRLSDAVATQERLVDLLAQNPWQSDELFWQRGNLIIYRRDLNQIDDDTLAAFHEYLEDFEKKFPWDTKNIATVLTSVSSCFEDLGYLDQALVHQQRATDLANQSSDTSHREAHIHNLGIKYESLGNISKAEELYRQALALAVDSQNPLWKANHLACIASCAQLQGHYEEAFACITSALAIREQMGDVGGIARDTKYLAGLLLTKGELVKALDSANKALEQASDLKLPLRDYYRQCAEINLFLGKISEANQLLLSCNENTSGVKWHFDNLKGILFLRQHLKKQAQEAFSQALAQSDLWLSRYGANPDAWIGKALALAGLVSCGQEHLLIQTKEAYLKAKEINPSPGFLTNQERLLEQLALSTKPKLFKDVFTDIFAKELIPMTQEERDQVFISYAHEDIDWVTRINKMLAPAIRNKSVDIWHDKKIKPGQKWREEIENALKKARVGVLLVTQDFLASDFINDQELPFLLNASEQHGVKIVWIYAKPSMVDETPIIELQCVHDFEKPLSSLPPHEVDQCILEIAKKIRTAYNESE